MATIKICDICDSRMNENDYYLAVTKAKKIGGEWIFRDLEMCPSCKEKIHNAIMKVIEIEEEKKNVQMLL